MLEHLTKSLEVKEISDTGIFTGYASIWGLVDMKDDIVSKGAFSNSLKMKTPKMLWQHDSFSPIGTWTEVTEDEKGLFVQGKLSLDTRLGNECYNLLKDGAIDGLSIGFTTVKDSSDEENRRIIEEIDLWEISVVTFPVQLDARVRAVKSMRQASQILSRYGGLSPSHADKIISNGWTNDEQSFSDLIKNATEALKD